MFFLSIAPQNATNLSTRVALEDSALIALEEEGKQTKERGKTREKQQQRNNNNNNETTTTTTTTKTHQKVGAEADSLQVAPRLLREVVGGADPDVPLAAARLVGFRFEREREIKLEEKEKLV